MIKPKKIPAKKTAMKKPVSNHCTPIEFEDKTLVLEVGKDMVVVQIKDIISIAVDVNNCTFRMRDNIIIVVRCTLIYLIEYLPANYFWQIHNSYVVGRKQIYKFLNNHEGKPALLMLDGSHVVIAQQKTSIIKKAIKEHALFLPIPVVKTGIEKKK